MKTFWLAVLASITGGIILLVLFSGFILPVVASVWHLVQDAFAWAWGGLLRTYSIPGWVIPLGVILPVVAVFSSRHILNRSKGSATRPAQRTFLSYTEDTIDGVKWRWRWIGRPPSITNLWCFCQRCDSQLLHFSYGWPSGPTKLVCERCPTQSNDNLSREDMVNLSLQEGRGHVIATMNAYHEEIWSAVEREIHRRVRTEEWQSTNISS